MFSARIHVAFKMHKKILVCMWSQCFVSVIKLMWIQADL